MKLHYYRFKDGVANFGDDLNAYLWEKLLPGVFDQDGNTLFVGIGTLLNNHLPTAQKTIVFGSGVGYGEGLPRVDQTWKIYCLRGLLSAERLHVSPTLALTDPAILVKRLFKPAPELSPHRYPFSYIPHVRHVISHETAWRKICDRAGVHFIDPRGATEAVLTEIRQTEVLLTEAMHGAIVADALRVPWIPISTNAAILPFKWQDWCSSIQVNYQPHYVMPHRALYSPGFGTGSSLRHGLLCLKQTPLAAINWLIDSTLDGVANQLTHIAKTSRPILSQERLFEALIVQLEEKIEQFKTDLTVGDLT